MARVSPSSVSRGKREEENSRQPPPSPEANEQHKRPMDEALSAQWQAKAKQQPTTGSMAQSKSILKKTTSYGETREGPRSVSLRVMKAFKSEFDSTVLEKLCRKYFARQKRISLLTLLLTISLFNVGLLIMYGIEYRRGSAVHTQRLITLSVATLFDWIGVALFAFTQSRSQYANLLPKCAWLAVTGELLSDLIWNYSRIAPNDSVGAWLAWMHITYTMMHFQLPTCVGLSAILAILHYGIVYLKVRGVQDDLFKRQFFANFLLFLATNVVGVVAFVAIDSNQRKGFMETREALAVKLTLEQQNKEQRRLLMSILPIRLAMKIIRDMRSDGTILTGGAGFKNIYIDRHESCSILFADIVGFTEYSSKVTAEQLIVMLNELFASFDKFAKIHKCERIKILGDCYYCISGLERNSLENHAHHSVEMGLDMVKHITKVREQTQVSKLDMRVGIHTGDVLAGVIGQRKWQFDVWSNDVTLANSMESGGVPGRVHITSATYVHVQDLYDVDPGDGQKRNDFLRDHGITTYLIRGRINHDQNEDAPDGVEAEKLLGSREGSHDSFVSEKKAEQEGRIAVAPDGESEGAISVDEVTTTGPLVKTKKSNERELDTMLATALEQRSSSSKIGINPITMTFRDPSTEQQYYNTKRSKTLLSLACPLCLVLASFLVEVVLREQSPVGYTSFGASLLIVAAVFTFAAALRFARFLPKPFGKLLSFVHLRAVVLDVMTGLCILVILAGEVADMIYQDQTTHGTGQDPQDGDHAYHVPQYRTFVGVVTLLVISSMVQFSHTAKGCLVLVTMTIYIALHFTLLADQFDRYDDIIYARYTSDLFVPKKLTMTVVIVMVALVLMIHLRQVERTARELFVWKQEAFQKKQEVETMRLRNDQIMRNILPELVCEHFLKAIDHDEMELYSRSYACVGVMFASIPDFSSFYTEESFNKGGIECIRFLNEIISDFDELLTEARFNSIEKIKTVNSTYMAASGLMLNGQKQAPSDPPCEEWQHLVDLADFALCLKEKLNCLNTESFNSFELRIGISHGPVVAGVIGAKKPHYDIWGNTVNTASRMESTGKTGAIQMLKSTYDILKDKGFQFEQRGFINVKGKGRLLTYFLLSSLK